MTDATAPTRPAAGSVPIRRNPLSAAFRVLAVDRSAMVGCLIILGFCLVALLAPLIAPFDPTEQHILDALQPPSATRSEEHTSELQSLMRISYAVFCLKKKNTT